MAVIEEIPEEMKSLLTKLRFPPSSETIAETKEILAELLKRYSYAKLNRILKMLGITSNLYYWCLKLHVPVRRHRDAVTVHPTRDFDGDKHEMMYLCGLIEDYNVYRRSSNRIRAQSGSTHPGFIRLTHSVFEKWGHVTETPCFSKTWQNYYMHVTVALNKTFDFLIYYKENRIDFLDNNVKGDTIYDFVSGLIDSEGSLNVVVDDNRTYVTVKISNTNEDIISWLKEKIGGYKSTRTNNGDNLVVSGRCKSLHTLIISYDNAINLLKKIRPRHPEKVLKMHVILHTLYDLRKAREQLMLLNQEIDKEIKSYQSYIRQKYIERHGSPHPLDPNK